MVTLPLRKKIPIVFCLYFEDTLSDFLNFEDTLSNIRAPLYVCVINVVHQDIDVINGHLLLVSNA
ncbi:hypothetical protein CHS0354_031710 [Potamilus streckersoni]|uniref:Uncharacterized protein n=1 Tax=Potamilus streckersoni TaxID=2493646 RepID=A0AAE0TB56_9BIVA|nr:hypothetical protein CHS0354_031710 [Potamilus streckersoni]